MQEERKMILKMIEDGKISAEEGMRLLETINEREKQAEPEPEQTSFEDDSAHSDRNSQESGEWSYRRAEEKMTSFANKFSGFVDDAVHRLKEFDLDFNFGTAEKIDHVFQQRDVYVKEADIHVENGAVEIRPSDEKKVRIECDVQVFRVKDAETARREFLREAQFSISNGRLRFDVRKKSMKVNTVVYLPTGDLEKLKIYAFNGRINAGSLPVHKLDIRGVNSKIAVERIDAKEARIETTNGSITVRQFNAMDGELKSMNGTVTVDAGRGDFHLESVNGTLHFRLSEASQSKAYLKTVMGSVYVAVPDGVKVEADVKTTVGGLHCQLPNMSVIEEKKDYAQKRQTFLANKEGDGHFYIEAESTTGSIHVK
ncbi:DUF4097 family beta strand repeat-containing protein [Alkalicoccus luteus]|uniref:DUF4097 family beta strand repeat-containing protein n=1 Tax=Alkalicoccus luteus TaxID=1237094 RepID=UPI00403328A8